MLVKRCDVYAQINHERRYQDMKYPVGGLLSVGSHLSLIASYLQQADHEYVVHGHQAVLHTIRKIGTLCVRAMEFHGAPLRGDGTVRLGSARSEVYDVIDGERSYQDEVWQRGVTCQIGDYLTLLRYYSRQADAMYTTQDGDIPALHVVRKLAALCVRMMEVHGAPERGQ